MGQEDFSVYIDHTPAGDPGVSGGTPVIFTKDLDNFH
jgi:hypothetical protein